MHNMVRAWHTGIGSATREVALPSIRTIYIS